jgi:hypothetical protein
MALTGYVSGLIVQSVPTKGNMKVDRFTADGTWTVPAGVTYAVAHIRGGGGGSGTVGSTGGAGGTSSVAFASGTISATGGNLANNANAWGYNISAVAGVANSGQGASRSAQSDPGPGGTGQRVVGSDGAYVVAGAEVTPAASITVTVGAGGTAGSGGAAGGSGYVWIEYLA